ncbi:hypothetical protein GUJ93_ZPchr0010g7378 [Zizania palustris]|uniref:Uncharacterized protein n=1 Tax=Zizania palustris TaxID=103762 RepID=A0A8J5W795_ZIZPA|nr:hypothetical protein GUJ93_ZPchr0010g7378 [Zizania palustris]
MQRLSVGSPGGKLRLDGGAVAKEADEKAGKAAGPPPDKSIHLIPLLTLFCFLVLFLLSHDPSSSLATDSPVLAAAARSLEATGDWSMCKIFPTSAWLVLVLSSHLIKLSVSAVETTASIGLKEEPRLARGRRFGVALRRRR